MSTNIHETTAQDTLSLDELSLYHQVMDYRASVGLAAIPLSKSLTTTAGRHVVDMRDNIWPESPRFSTLHDWSDATYHGANGSPDAMWSAPQRLGTGYASPGYEIAAAGQANGAAALETWKNSPAHDAILTETGSWANQNFKTIGIGLDASSGPGIYAGRIYYVWFGAAADSKGPPNIVGTSRSETISGTDFADIIGGGRGNDTIGGESGADSLSGGRGDDQIFGGLGNDHLSGGPGADTLIGGKGQDVMTGRAGEDVFRFDRISESPASAARDTITDFEHNTDQINLWRIDASSLSRGNQSFDFIGGAGFHHTAGELRYAGGIVSGDTNGDGRADFQIHLSGNPHITAEDFIL